MMDNAELRMKYAGAIGLLCHMSAKATEDERELIAQAAQDWCDTSGWTVIRDGWRVEVEPLPKENDNG